MTSIVVTVTPAATAIGGHDNGLNFLLPSERWFASAVVSASGIGEPEQQGEADEGDWGSSHCDNTRGNITRIWVNDSEL